MSETTETTGLTVPAGNITLAERGLAVVPAELMQELLNSFFTYSMDYTEFVAKLKNGATAPAIAPVMSIFRQFQQKTVLVDSAVDIEYRYGRANIDSPIDTIEDAHYVMQDISHRERLMRRINARRELLVDFINQYYDQVLEPIKEGQAFAIHDLLEHIHDSGKKSLSWEDCGGVGFTINPERIEENPQRPVSDMPIDEKRRLAAKNILTERISWSLNKKAIAAMKPEEFPHEYAVRVPGEERPYWRVAGDAPNAQRAVPQINGGK